MAGSKTEIEIDGKNTGAVLAINGVKRELGALGNTVNGPFRSTMGNLTRMLSFGAVAGAVTSLGYLVKSTIDTADELSKMSQKIGVSTESLSVLKYAAELSDLSMNQMQNSLKKLSTNLYDVAHGNGKDAALAFSELGISTSDASGKIKLTEDVLLSIADRFANMEDGVSKTALAVKLFGRSGADMIPFLNQGATGIKALTDEAEKLGLKISTETGQAAEQFNDTLTTFKNQITGLATESLPPLLNKLNNFTTGVIDLNRAVQDFSGESLFQGLYRAVSNFQTMGIDLDKVSGIQNMMQNYIKYQKELKVHTNEVNKVFYETFGIQNQIYPLMIDNTNKENDSLNNQLNTVKRLKNEYAKLIQTVAHGSPQSTASMASSPYTQIADYQASYEMFKVEENPFDPLANYAIDFFNMYDERASTMRQQTSVMFGNMGDAASMFYEMSGQKSKEWFAVQKGFNIAQALMNTYEGATKALAQGGFFGIAMAATVIAAGLAQVAMIASQQPRSSSGGSTGASSAGSTPSIANTPQLPGGGGKGQQIININFNGTYLGDDKDKFAREIVESLRKAGDDGYLIN